MEQFMLAVEQLVVLPMAREALAVEASQILITLA
jgi:hypothetical protein